MTKKGKKEKILKDRVEGGEAKGEGEIAPGPHGAFSSRTSGEIKPREKQLTQVHLKNGC